MPPVTDKCVVPLGMKFGCRPKQVPHLLNVAKQLHLDVVGVRSALAISLSVLGFLPHYFWHCVPSVL